MEKARKIVLAFLNSAEGYFHCKRILEDQVKQPRGQFGPLSDRPERWDYTDIRDIKKEDYDNIVNKAVQFIDKDLYKVIPDVALRAALDFAIYTFDKFRFRSKINAPTYELLFNILKSKV